MPPIILCVNGHNICDTCRPKIRQCPICRQQFLSTRNLALEKLARDVKYPCSYRKYGCEEFFVHSTVREHQHRCHHRPQTCPVPKVSNAQCNWTGIYDDIKIHLVQQHRGVCYEYIEREFRNMIILPDMIRYQFLFALNEVFYLRFQANNDTFYAVVQYVGPSENAAKYKYNIVFVNSDNTQGVAVMHLTRSFGENSDDIFKSGNCGKLHYDVVRRLGTKEGDLKFKIEILRGGE